MKRFTGGGEPAAIAIEKAAIKPGASIVVVAITRFGKLRFGEYSDRDYGIHQPHAISGNHRTATYKHKKFLWVRRDSRIFRTETVRGRVGRQPCPPGHGY